MTKIVGTLGPKSRSIEVISGCLKAGMSGELRYFGLFLHLDEKFDEVNDGFLCV